MGPSMQINLDSRPASKVEAEALVSYVFEPEKEQGTIVQGVVADLDQAAGGALGRLAADGELTGKMLEFTLVHFAPGISAQRVVLVGAGKREKFGTAELRRLASAAVRYLKARSVKRIAFLARESERTAEAAQAVTEGLVLGNFDGDKYRTDKAASDAAVSLRNHKTSLANSVTSLPICLRLACLPSAPKRWPVRLASRWTFSTKNASRNSRWAR